MKIRTSGLALALLGVLALAPSAAHAWTEQTINTDQGNSNAFTDPDDRVERMAGTSDDDQGYSGSDDNRNGGSGFHFSVTQQTIPGMMPFGAMSSGPFAGPGFGFPGR